MIGGGVSAAGDLLLLPAQRAFSRTLTGRGFREEARLVLAHFRNDAGLIGAADLARHAMIEPPDSARFGFWPRRRKRRASKARRRRIRADPTSLSHRLSALQHGAVTGVGRAVRAAGSSGCRIRRRSSPTASQPAQVGKRRPKVLASTMRTA